jgi:hypothetical protein
MSEHRLSEVVIERPRHGWRISLKKYCGYRKQLDKLTQEASEDGLFRPYLIKPRNKTKSLSDHLGPLRRYLHAKVGQPWNDVYSELCRRLDTSTLAGQHVLSHVWGYVERHVELREGIPYHKTSWGGVQRPLTSGYYGQLYVHPETGILCLLARNAPALQSGQKSQPQAVESLFLDRDHEYRQLAGIWYLITFADLPRSPDQYVFDVLLKDLICRDLRNYKTRYAAHKRQCNKKEIRLILKRISHK